MQKARIGICIGGAAVAAIALMALLTPGVQSYPNLLKKSEPIRIVTSGVNGDRLKWISDHELLTVSYSTASPWTMEVSITDIKSHTNADLTALNTAISLLPESFRRYPYGFTISEDRRWVVWSTRPTRKESHGKMIAMKADGSKFKEIAPPSDANTHGSWSVTGTAGPNSFNAVCQDSWAAKKCVVDIEQGRITMAGNWDRPNLQISNAEIGHAQSGLVCRNVMWGAGSEADNRVGISWVQTIWDKTHQSSHADSIQALDSTANKQEHKFALLYLVRRVKTEQSLLARIFKHFKPEQHPATVLGIADVSKPDAPIKCIGEIPQEDLKKIRIVMPQLQQFSELTILPGGDRLSYVYQGMLYVVRVTEAK